MMATDLPLSTEHLEKVDALINEALETFNVPGAAVGIVVDDKIILQRGYGSRDLKQNLPVTENTLFSIGSCTKAFTCLILGQLVDEAKIAWDDPVLKYIPEFRLYDQELTSRVTIRDLVAHRTGIPRNDAIWFFMEFSRTDVLGLLKYFEPTYGLRKEFLYNNFMYSVAGIIIERITGQTWEEVVSSRIFVPLSMHHSKLAFEKTDSNFSLPYAEINGVLEQIPYHYAPCVWPGGGINSNVAEMIKWIQCQLSDGKILNENFIRKETLKEMHTIHIPFTSSHTSSRPGMLADNDEIYQLGYGLGWFIGKYRENHFVSHGGILDGYLSEVSLLPEQKIGLVVLTNSSSDGIYVASCIRNTIFDMLLRAEKTDWMQKNKEARNKAKQALQAIEEERVEDPKIHLQDYIGHYEHPAYGIVQVYIKENQLTAAYAGMTFVLKQKDVDVFKAAFFPQLLIFSISPYGDLSFCRNPSGNIHELHIPFEGFRAAKPIVFKKK